MKKSLGICFPVCLILLSVTQFSCKKTSPDNTKPTVPIVAPMVVPAHLVPIGNLTVARSYMSVAALGNKILFAGGVSGVDYSKTVDIYDIGSNSWSTGALTFGAQGRAVASVGSKIFFAGGGNNDAGSTIDIVDIYDVSTNLWSAAHLSIDREYLAAATIGNKIFFSGGGNWASGGFDATDRIDIYDNVTGTWSQDHLSEHKTYHTATTVGDKMFIAGGQGIGFDSTGFISSSEIDIYDSTNKSWSKSWMEEGKYLHAAFATTDKIFWAFKNDVEIRDLSNGQTTRHALIPNSPFNIVEKDNKLIFFGNLSGDAKFDIYDMVSDTWFIGQLDMPLTSAAIISVNNVIYVAGGYNDIAGPFDNVWKLEF